ncbi:bifunctional DNA-formamidopyrimidine glycosylase/DNA-(apurinic or apyrimidinic site) lyase [Candidatus Gracilibacteria bacterium]|nr:bifunctional DNA-formamidopyrimidine glycosylase/DNA-(apurinic or apyrimidinic site) lyase [Candidatus Gracilibacteria bacterium]MCF7897089.1 bifunctional DNA-formamidopyrimidine glycosylase/DNA-(apurinic or apyrimidinic site) lyase [Candidatus Gracilibacteria bacterium]
MPELPEVETQVRDLQILVGHKILTVTTDTPKAFRPTFTIFQKCIEGKKILAIERRAKFLVFTLTKNWKMIVHFRMTGHFLLAKNSAPLEKCIRHFFQISGGTVLQFSDIRKFATLELVAPNTKSVSLEKLGVEPLDREFTFLKFREIIKKKKGKLKAFLLDQKNVVGIGNIYADEICFASSIHPAAEIQNLSEVDLKNVFREIKKQLKKGIRNRGTTIGEYVDACGQSGRNQLSLMAYKRHGQECQVCGTLLQKMKIVQRTTSFCPRCQIKI